jgi:hypothetical protein
MNGQDWTEAIGACGVFALVTTVVTVAIIQVAATIRAKAVLAREDAYRRLAERAIETQEATERRLTALDERVNQSQARLASIEQVLKQVE